MRLQIEGMRGMWRAQIGPRTFLGETLEDVLYELAPDAPDELRWHAAEVLGGILGAEVVEVEEMSPQMTELDFSALADAIFGSQDEPEHWQPTDAQQAYFGTAPEIEDNR